MSEQLAEEVIAAALLLGAEIIPARGRGQRWVACGPKIMTGSYATKVDAAEGYLMRAGYQINAVGELQPK